MGAGASSAGARSRNRRGRDPIRPGPSVPDTRLPDRNPLHAVAVGRQVAQHGKRPAVLHRDWSTVGEPDRVRMLGYEAQARVLSAANERIVMPRLACDPESRATHLTVTGAVTVERI